MALFWGGTFVAGRLVSKDVGPFAASFLRFAIASACLVWIMRRREGGLPMLRPGQVVPAILLGLTGVFAYNAFFFYGLQTVHAGRAAVIVACNPMLTALLAGVFFKEPLPRRKVAGVCLSLCGAAVAIGRGNPAALFSDALSMGDVSIVGCVASWVSYSLLGKRIMHDLAPQAAVTWSCIFGTLALAVPAFAEGMVGQWSLYPPIAWICLAYLAVCGTVLGFTWFYEGVKALGAGRAAVFINFVPVTAILFGWLLLGEPLPWSLLAGGGMVCCGVYLANSLGNGAKRSG